MKDQPRGVAAACVDPERLAALAELAYGASHEINNPLANISTRAQALLREETHPERRRTLEAIHEQALRAHEMISDLMLFARPPALNLGCVDVAALVREGVAAFRGDCERRGVRLDLDAPATLSGVRGDREQLAVALRALLRNALESCGETGTIDVVVAAGRRLTEEGGADEGAGVRVVVADDGRGLTPREQAHAFDPFFSGREAGRGLGFGLPKCWRIVTAHGGELSLHGRDPRGVVATIWVPVTAGES